MQGARLSSLYIRTCASLGTALTIMAACILELACTATHNLRVQTKASRAELAALLIFHKKKSCIKNRKSLMINSAVVKFKANHFTELLDVEIVTAILCCIRKKKKKPMLFESVLACN